MFELVTLITLWDKPKHIKPLGSCGYVTSILLLEKNYVTTHPAKQPNKRMCSNSIIGDFVFSIETNCHEKVSCIIYMYISLFPCIFLS